MGLVWQCTVYVVIVVTVLVEHQIQLLPLQVAGDKSAHHHNYVTISHSEGE